MEVTGLLNDCYVPDKNNTNNILFDSCIYDKRLYNNLTDIDTLKSARRKGYLYFTTHVQEREICGVPDRNYAYDKPWTPNPNAKEIMEIFNELDVKRVSCLANIGYQYFTLLDGTYRLIEDENCNDERVIMFYDIYNHNKRHLRDAIIAEAAIYNNCNLISVDKRLIRKVNRHFENRAINYDEFIKTL